MSSVVVVCNAAGVRAGQPPGAWTVGTPAAGLVGIGRPTLHGGPVRLRPVRATNCFYNFYSLLINVAAKQIMHVEGHTDAFSCIYRRYNNIIGRHVMRAHTAPSYNSL